MKRASNTKRAFTLIEVVASLVLLATTVTALLTTNGRSLEQLRAIREQETASSLAHEWIAIWKLNDTKDHLPMEGRFENHPGWRWPQSVKPYEPTYKLTINEITLTIYHQQPEKPERVVTHYTWLEAVDEP